MSYQSSEIIKPQGTTIYYLIKQFRFVIGEDAVFISRKSFVGSSKSQSYNRSVSPLVRPFCLIKLVNPIKGPWIF